MKRSWSGVPRQWLRGLLLLLLILPPLARAGELKLATWNLEWLTTRPAGDPALPSDVQPKQASDIALLAGYAAKLNADVVAIQEVDGAAIAARIFPSDRYVIRMTHDDLVQRVGLVIRRGIDFSRNPDVTALDPPYSHLRSGEDVTLHLDAGPLRILAVHLKTGCRDSPLLHARRKQCRELAEQVPALTAWIAARQAEGIPFIIMGDFNRWMDGHDQLWATLRRAAPLTRATQGFASPCWGGESFIDHIIAGGPAREWLEPGTLRVLVFSQTGDDWKERLSDHCPVSIRLRLPG